MAELCRLCGKDVLADRGMLNSEDIDFRNVKRGLCCLCYLKNTTREQGMEYSMSGDSLTVPYIVGCWCLQSSLFHGRAETRTWRISDYFHIHIISISYTNRAEPEDRMVRGEIPPYKYTIP